jgi:hypothetical protein
MNEIEEAEAEMLALAPLNGPLQAAFVAADCHLRNCWDRRKQGVHVPRATMVAAYDERLMAGHEWNPTKKKIAELQRWLKELRTTLAAVNKEIGI